MSPELSVTAAPKLLRQQLNGEFHARPPLPLLGSTRIRHMAFLSEGQADIPQRVYLDRLVKEAGWTVAEQSDAYCVLVRGAARIRWELHTEFSSYTLLEPLDAAGAVVEAVDAGALDRWIADIPGEAIVALHIDHHATQDLSVDDFMSTLAHSDRQMVAANIVDGKAWVFTDFQFVDGEIHFVLLDAGMTRRQAGRTVQRLWEIETYRLLALLGFPVARTLSGWLRRAEEDLAVLMDQINRATSADAEHAVLNRLSSLAAEVEHSVAQTAFRFGASRAYAAIVMQRIDELREVRMTGFPTLREFMERRLFPPMNTCVAMATRQEELSARVARNSQLLRARVDIALERQNQEVLMQMNQRTRQQLHLQETVEGLSVVAITYYASQLVHYLAEGAHTVGLHVQPALVTALSIPLIAIAIAVSLRRLRLRILADPHADK